MSTEMERANSNIVVMASVNNTTHFQQDLGQYPVQELGAYPPQGLGNVEQYPDKVEPFEDEAE